MNASPAIVPRLYSELAAWWPLLSDPAEYAEEAAIYSQVLRSACANAPRTLLELGSGGGNNASHLAREFEMTLVDLSPGMLEVSRALNPACRHLQGDLRTFRIPEMFDAVFIQDAIMYMASEQDLRRAIEAAWLHCKPGGAALFAPDHVQETFRPGTSCGGHDQAAGSETTVAGRALRYMEWTWDPDPTDQQYFADYAYLLREGDQVRVEHDRHVLGLFPIATWERIIQETGFRVRRAPLVHSEVEPGACQLFVGVKE